MDEILNFLVSVFRTLQVGLFAILREQNVDLSCSLSSSTTEPLNLEKMSREAEAHSQERTHHANGPFIGIVTDRIVDLSNIKTLLANGCCYQDIIFSSLEIFNELKSQSVVEHEYQFPGRTAICSF